MNHLCFLCINSNYWPSGYQITVIGWMYKVISIIFTFWNKSVFNMCKLNIYFISWIALLRLTVSKIVKWRVDRVIDHSRSPWGHVAIGSTSEIKLNILCRNSVINFMLSSQNAQYFLHISFNTCCTINVNQTYLVSFINIAYGI